jgi:6-pyruvoyl-tetrahydropterin synthase
VTINIFVRFQFSAFHRWPNAPDKYRYLANIHRHVFHVKVVMQVLHGNRDVEFIELKEQLQKKAIMTAESNQTLNYSCEQWAKHFLDANKNFTMVEVSEDGENGAIVTRED